MFIMSKTIAIFYIGHSAYLKTGYIALSATSPHAYNDRNSENIGVDYAQAISHIYVFTDFYIDSFN